MTKTNGSTAIAAPTAGEIKALLYADRQQRASEAMRDIESILAEKRCQLVPVTVMRGNEVTHTIEIQALD